MKYRTLDDSEIIAHSCGVVLLYLNVVFCPSNAIQKFQKFRNSDLEFYAAKILLSV